MRSVDGGQMGPLGRFTVLPPSFQLRAFGSAAQWEKGVREPVYRDKRTGCEPIVGPKEE